MNLAWAIRRLSAMSGREVAYRIGQRVRNDLDRFHDGAARPPIIGDHAAAKPWVAPLPRAFDAGKYTAAAERILGGELRVFALRPARLGFPPQWNRDPKTGTTAPLVRGTCIDYRDEALVGDIKYLWEPSRHAALVTLAQAWHLSGEIRYAHGCRQLLQSWFEQCPYALGPHWASSLELALRLLNWSFAWHLLGAERSPLFVDRAGQGFRQQWLASVFQHCRFIETHLSRHSSANNHLLGELTGLFIAALTWPLWGQSSRWRDRARAELGREALLQNAADGVNREQAIWYHHEVADMMLAAGLTARANGCDFSEAYWLRLQAMLEHIASVMDAGGNVPAFGDADDAIVAPLDPDDDAQPYRSLLATGAVLFERADFKAKVRTFDDKSRWLLGDEAAARFARLDSATVRCAPRRAFEEGGYYVLGSRFETPQEVRLVADAGPLGYLSIAAHGHADALSFTLSAGGTPLLIDPGTYAYHTQRRWRDYFRGTSAHNTVRVDGLDQSVIGGNFLWLRHAQSRVLQFEASPRGDRLLAEHDGYRRLRDPVTHRRELRLDHASSTLLVIDELLCKGDHRIEIFWHFAAECDVQNLAGGVRAMCDRVQLTIAPPAGASCELVRGREQPPLGWYSPRFDCRLPCTTLVASAAIHGDTQLVTSLQWSFAPPSQ